MGRRRKYATLEEVYSEKNRRRREQYVAAKKEKENGPFNTTCTIAVKALRMVDSLAETSTSSTKRMRINKHNDNTYFANMSTDDTIENLLSSSSLMKKYGSLVSSTFESDEALTPINIHGKSIANIKSIPIEPKDNASDCNTLSIKKAAPCPKTSSSINSSSYKDNDVKVSFDGQRRRKYATPEEAQGERNRRRRERYAIAKKAKQKSSVDNISTVPLITPEMVNPLVHCPSDHIEHLDGKDGKRSSYKEGCHLSISLQEDIRTNANFKNSNHMPFNDESVFGVRSCLQGKRRSAKRDPLQNIVAEADVLPSNPTLSLTLSVAGWKKKGTRNVFALSVNS